MMESEWQLSSNSSFSGNSPIIKNTNNINDDILENIEAYHKFIDVNNIKKKKTQRANYK